MENHSQLKKIYKFNDQKINRFSNLLTLYFEKFGQTSNFEYFSCPGRTEIIGNHTDHNFGKVVCSSIDLDTIAIAEKNGSDLIRLISLEHNEDYTIDIKDLEKKQNDTWSCVLVKGLIYALSKIGNIGGFNILVSSDVIASAGVSSSASFEMLICQVVNSFFNDDKLDIISLAKCGQYSENHYWNKSSGLLDQIACGYGGLITIDFKDINNPIITKLDSTDLENNYDIIITPTGGEHSDLGEEYSSIPREMKSIANKELRYIDKDYLLNNFNEIRQNVSDRAILRAFHFFDENERVDMLIDAINNKEYATFLNIVINSGDSSWKYLQNCYLNTEPNNQPISTALALTKYYFETNKIKGAYRVHGGGFAGVIMTIIPKNESDKYIDFMQNKIKQTCYKVSMRQYGATNISKL